MSFDRHAPVGSLMATELLTATPDTGLDEARECFMRSGVHHLPIVDDDGELLGILSHTDLYKCRASEPGAAAKTVADLMTDRPVSVRPDDPLELAVALLAGGVFHAVPVVDDDEFLVGLLTTSDILRSLIPEAEDDEDDDFDDEDDDDLDDEDDFDDDDEGDFEDAIGG
ncbi:MAG: CBS domain-containing protein [Deltaproteobacteria bacterium]|nr:MAG: CBS domain-containing protein [Deltaproteobacteria bacterium]